MSSQHDLYTTRQVSEGQEHNLNRSHSFGSYSSLSKNDSTCSTSTFSLRNCGEKRKRKCSSYFLGSSKSLDKYRVLNNSNEFSTKLSRESNTNFCEYDDELSDNDLIEIQNTPSNFKKLHHGHKKSFENKQKKTPYIESLYTRAITPQQDDALNALKELDAVIDIHDSFSHNKKQTDREQTNIEECLLDLDDYLEKLDECSVDDDSNDSSTSNINPHFQRGTQFRKTISCAVENKDLDTFDKLPQLSKGSPIYATWRPTIVNRSSLMGDPINSSLSKREKCQFNNTPNIGSVDESVTQLCSSDNCNSVEFAANVGVRRCFSQSDWAVEQPPRAVQALTEDRIFQNLIGQSETSQEDASTRPRQFGRRAERLARVSIPADATNQNFVNINYFDVRPMSAPAASGMSVPETHSENPTLYIGSDGSTARSSRNTSPVSIDSSFDSGESSVISNHIVAPNINLNEENTEQGTSIDPENMEAIHKIGFNSYWPHNYSRTLALISCTLGLFNICRFAILTINYGGNFLIQFLIFSIIFGIPFLWLQMCLGAKIKSGPISMWKISPICSGIGISLVLVQYFIAIYSSVVIVWLLVYIGDIFMYQSSYRWSESMHSMIPRHSTHAYNNLTERVPDYFNINVLQRLQVLKIVDGNGIRLHISDRLAFYLAILWATVFLILCKGLKSFGKVLIAIGLLPIVVLAVITGKMLYVVDLDKLQNVFSSSELDDFLINSKTWTAAAQETFLTWGLLGASIIAITSRTHKKTSKMTLRRDAILVVLSTLIGLCLSALIGLCCIQILNQSGYVYVPGSYENPESYLAIYSLKSTPNIELISYPSKYVPHYSGFIGEVYRRQTDIKSVSGYQVLRFVSEILPAVIAISTDSISWIWASIIFLTLFVFGIAQLCVMWKPIASALGNSTSSVLLSCVTGLLLSIPFATEIGITLLHFMDILVGGAWFIPILWAAEIFGVFLIRGRPYNGDDLVNDLKMSGSMSAFLALSWNILLPIGLMTLAVMQYKTSLSSQFYCWRGRSYFSYWSRKVGALTQIGFLLLVPITAIIQIYRYLTSGPPDVLDRIQMLYRPLDGTEANRGINRTNRNILDSRYQNDGNGNRTDSGINNLQDDAPPKYTPPPSYTTATGARLAKILRQSIRRSVRRILGDSGRTRPILSMQMETQHEHTSFPPDYSSILTTSAGASNAITPSISETIEIENRPILNSLYGRSLSLGRKQCSHKNRFGKSLLRPSSAPRDNYFDTVSGTHSSNTERPYTAEDVITILRSSTRGRRRSSHSVHPHSEFVFRSIENLVLNAEPPGLSSTIHTDYPNQNDENQNTTSVI